MSAEPQAPQTAQPRTVATTLENAEVINHLLFHKALLADDEDGSRLNQYISLAREGEHVSIKDPVDRSIALAFDLVVQNQLNPWDIDLVKFSQMYLENARERKLDLVTAGRIILMAWTVLKLQSADLVRRTEERKIEVEQAPDWSDLPDWGLSGPELDFTERVRMSPRAPIDEKVWHEGDRKVTLMELVDAFEHARQEAEARQKFMAERDAFRDRLKSEGRAKFKNRVHKEDLEADIQMVWARILGLNGAAIPFRQIVDERDPWDVVTAFNSILFLHRDRKIDVWQENFPFGPIFLQNRMVEAHAPAAAPAPEPKGESS